MEPSKEILIGPQKRWWLLDLSGLVKARELLYFLTWRDIKVRYKQTLLGVSWAILQPFSTMIVFSIFFGKLANMPSDGIPYPVFTFAALLPWQLFSRALSDASGSLTSNQQLVTKVYFPRLLLPVASILAGFVDFLIAFLLLLSMMFFFGLPISAHVVWLPLFVALAVMTALAAGIFLAAVNIQYRDVRYVLPFLTQCWMFATPIAYPSSLVPEKWRVFYGLNPMAGVIEGFRWSLLGTGDFPVGMIMLSAVIVLFSLGLAIAYFQAAEDKFADII